VSLLQDQSLTGSPCPRVDHLVKSRRRDFLKRGATRPVSARLMLEFAARDALIESRRSPLPIAAIPSTAILGRCHHRRGECSLPAKHDLDGCRRSTSSPAPRGTCPIAYDARPLNRSLVPKKAAYAPQKTRLLLSAFGFSIEARHHPARGEITAGSHHRDGGMRGRFPVRHLGMKQYQPDATNCSTVPRSIGRFRHGT